ncbi:hypothetical protein [Cellulomonas wangsupingiae]|uniref:Lipocalin-like domain-containing protein n=1 Tax=Cellulomonas wangsupingiae TaxID=2968085 RepID=A0ABY5K3C9_9CELL|nr:hypothetical protein [Cellulomonas wangsupingiae]MCC2335536.1 hypothetical protein [Cellulomonas wangsupingiae]UUI64293.1 hypothetical protein NP075_14350 [Cellulomonas wangsupingiae]
MRRTPAVTVTALTALLLTACTGGDREAAPSGGATPADASAGASADASPGAPADAGGGTQPDAPFDGGTEQCLVGVWRLDLAAMQDDLSTMLAGGGEAAGDVEVEVEGATTYEFAADGSFAAAVDSSSSMTLSSDGEELTSSTASTGDLTGVWSLAGDVLTISDVDAAGLDVTTTAALGGESIDVPPGSAQDAIEALPPTVSTVTCGTATLTLATATVADEDSDPVSLTYTLRR